MPQLSSAPVAALGLLVRLVEKGVEHVDADQRRSEVDLHARDPLGGLEGEHQRGDEGEEAARLLARLDHLEAAVDDDHRDRQAAERLGQRARTRADHRQPVGGALEAGDRLALARAHEGLEREGLDDPDALHGLLQRFQDDR